MAIGDISFSLPFSLPEFDLPALMPELPELPDIWDYSPIIDQIDSVLPHYVSSLITFAAACLVTAQIAIGIIAGTTGLTLTNTVILAGCWLGYKYINDQTYLERLEETAESFRLMAEEQRALVQKRDEQLEASRVNVVNLREQAVLLQAKLDEQSRLIEDYSSQIEKATVQGGDRERLIQQRAELIQQKELQLQEQNRQITRLQELVESMNQAAEERSQVEEPPALPAVPSVLQTQSGQSLMAAMQALRALQV